MYSMCTYILIKRSIYMEVDMTTLSFFPFYNNISSSGYSTMLYIIAHWSLKVPCVDGLILLVTVNVHARHQSNQRYVFFV